MSCCNDKSCTGEKPSTPTTSSYENTAPHQAVFLIENMCCPTEERIIRDRLNSMVGIASLQFNLLQRELLVRHSLPSIAPMVAVLNDLKMGPQVKADSLVPDKDASKPEVKTNSSSETWGTMAISGIAAVGAEAISWYSGDDSSWPVVTLALLAILVGGRETLKKGWTALRHFSLNMNFLMSLAVIGAAAIGQWPEAAVVIFLFAVAELVEGKSMDRARDAIGSLMAMTPEIATTRLGNGSWKGLPAADVKVGAVVRVRPGERVPLDGVILVGETNIDQAPITGESLPVAKQPGDPVYAGTVNANGEFEFEVTARQANSTLSRIVQRVQQAQSERAPTQRFVDQFARYYIPVVVALAILVAIVPPLLLGAEVAPWVYKALVLLVIACPCALVISTPVTVVSGLTAAARRGILIKGGVYLENGRNLRAIAVDKTGTVTVGEPSVTDLITLDGDANSAASIAASLAARSDHPVSMAVTDRWCSQWPTQSLLEVEAFKAIPGRGVQGMVNGMQFYLGSGRWIAELGLADSGLSDTLASLANDGKSTVVLASAQGPRLIAAVADTLRPNSVEAIDQLKSMGIGVTMLSGDNTQTAQAIGRQLHMTDARGDLLPEDKLAAVSDLVKQHGYVGMVGDGINDAPALARADIGFAMGVIGTDTALETADVALMDDDLRKIPEFIRLSARTRAVLIQNITFALGIKLVFLIMALRGEATLWMAVFANMGASLLVVANGLRLLRDSTSRR